MQLDPHCGQDGREAPRPAVLKGSTWRWRCPALYKAVLLIGLFATGVSMMAEMRFLVHSPTQENWDGLLGLGGLCLLNEGRNE